MRLHATISKETANLFSFHFRMSPETNYITANEVFIFSLNILLVVQYNRKMCFEGFFTKYFLVITLQEGNNTQNSVIRLSFISILIRQGVLKRIKENLTVE